MSNIGRKYGWIRKTHDVLSMCSNVAVPSNMPKKVDLRDMFPSVYDQGELGSCTANAGASIVEYLMKLEGHQVFMPSRLFIYYNSRLLMGTTDEDSGATIEDMVNALVKNGAAHEDKWWYNIAKFKIKPNKSVYDDGLKHIVTDRRQINNTDINQLKACLANKNPFAFGFTVYESFESDEVASHGYVPMPNKLDKPLGGHAVVGVGYDDTKSVFIVRNSWGDKWGEDGYCYMPYSYLTNVKLAQDFWIMNKVK